MKIPRSQARAFFAIALFALGFSLSVTGRADAPVPADGKTYVIPVDGEIELALSGFITRVLAETKPEDLVVLQINTFGGRVDAAVQIRDALLASKAKTLAFIDSRAISAGALISLATDTIAMVHGGTIGAATPVTIEGGKMQPVEAKVVSYFRKEMKSTAEAKGRSGVIAEAMVDPAVEIPGLDGKETTLTLTTTEAIKHKMADFEAKSIAEVCTHMKRAPSSVIRPALTWAERVARFLAQGAVSSLLMSLGMLGILIELYSPGHAISGIVGVICLLLFFFGHYVVRLAGWEEALLFVIGAGIVVVEIVALPGHGMLAIFGVLLILASMVLALSGLSWKRIPLDISWSLGWIPAAIARVFGSIILTAVAMLAVSRFLPRTRFGRALILDDAITARASDAPASSAPTRLAIGAQGVADTVLRPAGKARFGSERVDVVTEGDFIEFGQPVIVVAIDGARIVVKQV